MMRQEWHLECDCCGERGPAYPGRPLAYSKLPEGWRRFRMRDSGGSIELCILCAASTDHEMIRAITVSPETQEPTGENGR